MQQSSSSVDWITILAIWGAILSTLLCIKEITFAIREFRKEKRRVRLIMTIGPKRQLHHEDNPLLESTLGPSFLKVQAINIGYRPITLVAIGLQMSNGYQYRNMTWDSPALPLKLDDGDRVEICFELTGVRRALIEQDPPAVYTNACMKDAEGQVYKGRLPKQLTPPEIILPSRRQQWSTSLQTLIATIVSAIVSFVRESILVAWELVLFPWQAIRHAWRSYANSQKQLGEQPLDELSTESAQWQHETAAGGVLDEIFDDEPGIFDNEPHATKDYERFDDIALFKHWRRFRQKDRLEARLVVYSMRENSTKSDKHKRRAKWK
jgi:hypothetical protein